MKRSKHAVAYGECGHSYSGCICPEFVYDPDLTRDKDDDAYEAACDMAVDMARDSVYESREAAVKAFLKEKP